MWNIKLPASWNLASLSPLPAVTAFTLSVIRLMTGEIYSSTWNCLINAYIQLVAEAAADSQPICMIFYNTMSIRWYYFWNNKEIWITNQIAMGEYTHPQKYHVEQIHLVLPWIPISWALSESFHHQKQNERSWNKKLTFQEWKKNNYRTTMCISSILVNPLWWFHYDAQPNSTLLSHSLSKKEVQKIKWKRAQGLRYVQGDRSLIAVKGKTDSA